MEKAIDFIKKHRFDIIVTCSVIAFLFDIYTGRHTFSFTVLCLYALAYAADNEKSQNNIAERKKQLPKGLVKEDLKNIDFVKSWDETRKKGSVKFSIVNGGIIFGFVLCFIISILSLLFIKDMLHYISADPSNMINFIGYTYIAGIIGGIITYRFLWTYNERKFIRLTDPLH
ncbi:hypothetical protein HDF18_11840 [Mucilaginibacter sp. X5P1]|uniref:hypothetical protein n=1 Tax=Mucilaginibacter sp. X5P1 TaxID=2723088 RepID=UPI00161473BD|nr:hypothetical protein [Mucilaginibacter sp. X5P1]MBB6140492.1 hypothetical protein [Mucilaginibacter sp. X5P1]